MSNIKNMITSLLRIISLGATFCATIIMATAHDSAQILGFKFEANYNNSLAFKYFVIVNAIVSCYSFVVLLVLYKITLWRLIIILDMVITLLLASSLSAAMAVAYVGKNGNLNAGWLPICGQVPKFCNLAQGALISSIIATIIYILLLLDSLYTALAPLFSFTKR